MNCEMRETASNISDPAQPVRYTLEARGGLTGRGPYTIAERNAQDAGTVLDDGKSPGIGHILEMTTLR